MARKADRKASKAIPTRSSSASAGSSAPPALPPLNEAIVERLIAEEQAAFAAAHPRSRALFEQGKEHYLYGGPSHWMRRWAGGFPIYVERAEGSRITDVDDRGYVDFCLGDTGGMCGHGVRAIADAVARQMLRGATTMLPTEESIWLGEELSRRFGLPYWGLATSASDANRAVIRIARMITGRQKVLVFNGCYHGSVEEAHLALRDGKPVLRNSIHPNGLDHTVIATVIEFNDVPALERALAAGDIACVLTEPIMTNCGMVPPAPGYHEALRAATRRAGTLLVIDETHTISSGPGGYAARHGLQPDMFVIGKAVAGGIPAAAFGLREDCARRLWERVPWVNPAVKQSAHLGFGGTLAGGALAVAAMSVVLREVLTEAAFARMISLAERLAGDVRQAIVDYTLPWHVTQLGARIEYMFSPAPPRNGSEATAARHSGLEALLHVFFMNRGVLLTPFHNMVLLCTASTEGDVARHTGVFREFAAWLEAKRVWQ